MARAVTRHTDQVWFDQNSIDGLLYAIGDCQRQRVAVEFGSWTGTSTLALARYFQTVLAVDPWEYLPGGPAEYEQVAEAYPVFCERTASHPNIIRFRTSDAQFMQTFDGPLDLLFIDAEHSYDAVLKSIGWGIEHVAPGGVIAGHDYGHEAFQGVTAAVDQMFDSVRRHSLVWWAVL